MLKKRIVITSSINSLQNQTTLAMRINNKGADMDLLVIIVNNYKPRKRIKSYLRNIGMGDYIVMLSSGTSSVNQIYNNVKSMIDLPFDDMTDNQSKGKTIFVVNHNEEKTQEYIDHIAEMFEQDKKKSNSGIVFSIPINDIFPVNLLKKPSEFA